MRTIRRRRAPAIVRSDAYRDAFARFADFHDQGGTRGKQGRSPLLALLEPFRGELDAALVDQFSGLCAYTEVAFTPVVEPSVRQTARDWTLHRPAANATSLQNEIDPAHYWWMAFDWRNLYLASARVIAVRGTSFPLVAGAARATPPTAAVPDPMPRRRRLDDALLLDPCADEPALWLRFGERGAIAARTPHDGAAPRGLETIRGYDLTNDELQRSRWDAIKQLSARRRAGASLTELLDWIDDDRPPHGGAMAQVAIRTALRERVAAHPVEARAPASRRSPLVVADIERCGDGHGGALVAEFVEADLRVRDFSGPERQALQAVAEAIRDLPELRRSDAFHTAFGLQPPEGNDAPASRTAVPDRRPPTDSTTPSAPSAPAPSDEPPASPPRDSAGQSSGTVSATESADTVAARRITPKVTITPGNMITGVAIKNFRAIRDVGFEVDPTGIDLVEHLDMSDDEIARTVSLHGRPWKVLLGENGSGKSSILHAIALALSGADVDAVIERAGLTWDDLLRWGDEDGRPNGEVRLDFTGGQTITLRFDDRQAWFFTEAAHRDHAPAMHLNIRGYGASRFPIRQRPGAPPLDRNYRLPAPDQPTSCNIDNLLDSTTPVFNSKLWLAELDDEAFNVAAETIGDLLEDRSLRGRINPDTEDGHADERDTDDGDADGRQDPSGVGGARPRITRDADDPTKVFVDDESLSLVSDGYRSVIALGCEIMAGIGGLTTTAGATGDMRDARGIVLIDEIGAHLHPQWRMQITGKFRQAFPEVQFFATTHEPLCLRGLVEGEVVRVLKYAEHGVVLDEIDRAPGRYRVDQLLTSEFFGLNSAIDPRLDRLFDEYYELRRKPQPSNPDLARLRELDAMINEDRLRPILGYTRRDQLIFEVVDDYLFRDGRNQFTPQKRQLERRRVVEKVKDIWNQLAPQRPDSTAENRAAENRPAEDGDPEDGAPDTAESQ